MSLGMYIFTFFVRGRYVSEQLAAFPIQRRRFVDGVSGLTRVVIQPSEKL